MSEEPEEFVARRQTCERQLREATTCAIGIVENLNAGFYLRLREEMFSTSAQHQSLDEARVTLQAYRGRLAKYHGRVARRLFGMVDAIELRGMPNTMRDERRVLVQICEMLENVLTAHHSAVDTFCRLLLASDEALRWERLRAEAIAIVGARRAASPQSGLAAAAAAAAQGEAGSDDGMDVEEPSADALTALGSWMKRGATDVHMGVQSMLFAAPAAAAALFGAGGVDAAASDAGTLPPASAAAAAVADAEALKTEGNRRVSSRDFKGAIACYSRAVRRACVAEQLERRSSGGGAAARDDGDAAARQLHIYLGNRAAANLHAGHYADAACDSRAALALEPTYAKHFARLGNAQLKLGEVEDAVASLRSALALDPRLGSAVANLADAERSVATAATAAAMRAAAAAAKAPAGKEGDKARCAARRAAIEEQIRALREELEAL
jgi:tetratricopeptide (TPR) repeat protein